MEVDSGTVVLSSYSVHSGNDQERFSYDQQSVIFTDNDMLEEVLGSEDTGSDSNAVGSMDDRESGKIEEVSFVSWLKYDKTKRELLFKLNNSLAKIKTSFSYLRLEGLSFIFDLLKNLTEDEIAVFMTLQDLNSGYKNVACEVFTFILNPDKTSKFSPISSIEKQKALEIWQQVLMLHLQTKEKLTQDNDDAVVKVLVENIDLSSQSQIPLLSINLLLSILPDMEINQEAFSLHGGMDKLLNIVKQKKGNKELRIKCLEMFDLVLNEFVYDYAKNQKKFEEILGLEIAELFKDKNRKNEEFIELIDKRQH